MFRTKTLDQILYKDRHYPGGVSINIEDKDVNKLIRQGAIDVNGFKVPEIKKTKVEINVIKNPIKAEDKSDPYNLPSFEDQQKEMDDVFEKTKGKTTFVDEASKVNKKTKRQYNKRGSDSNVSRSDRY